MGWFKKILGLEGPPPPPTPDYAGAAAQQAAASAAAARAQTIANRPNVTTPWGSQTWTEGPGGQWSQNISLSPQQQQALDAQMGIQSGLSTTARGMLGGIGDMYSQPMDVSGLPQRAENVQAGQVGQGTVAPEMLQRTLGDPNAWRSRAQGAVEQLQAPQLAQRRAAMETQLANQGITRGSEAYTNAMRDLGMQENQAQLQAIAAGRDEANAMFGQNLAAGQFGNQAAGQAFGQNLASAGFGDQRQQQQLGMDIAAGTFGNQNRQQALQEQMALRGQPLNELNALLAGQQVSSPQMPSFTAATKAETPQYLNAMNMQYGSGLDMYNAAAGRQGSFTGGLFDLGGAVLGSPWGQGMLGKIGGMFGFGG